ncbi:prefoldin subunit alpha [Candidatus Thorarchaeota archaeon]|nr:MAG: prefoldin subunit alpha [Candidatus Thorarchaeota archaeon]
MAEDQRQALQQLYIEQQMVASNLENVQERLDVTNLYLSNYQKGLEVLHQLEKQDTESELFFNVGGGLFIEARITQPVRIISDLGSGARVEVDRQQAIENAKEIIKKLEEQRDSLRESAEQMEARAVQLNARMQELAEKIQSEEGQPSV